MSQQVFGNRRRLRRRRFLTLVVADDADEKMLAGIVRCVRRTHVMPITTFVDPAIEIHARSSLLVPKDTVEVRWLRHTDERCHEKEFFDATSQYRAALLAQSRQVASKGLVSKVPENGHPLQPPYEPIIVLKPGDFRFFGFRDGATFFIVSAAPKKDKKQDPDYRFAHDIYKEYDRRKRALRSAQKPASNR